MHTLICVTFSLPPVGCDFCLWLFLDFSVYLFAKIIMHILKDLNKTDMLLLGHIKPNHNERFKQMTLLLVISYGCMYRKVFHIIVAGVG